MSFAGDTKNSLCSAMYGRAGKGQKGQSRSKCCLRSMLYGMLLFSTQSPPRPLRMITENEAAAKQLLTLLSHCLGVRGTLTVRERQTGGEESSRPRSYKVTAEGEEAARTLAAFCGGEQGSEERISKAYFVCPDCLRSFGKRRVSRRRYGCRSEDQLSSGYHRRRPRSCAGILSPSFGGGDPGEAYPPKEKQYHLFQGKRSD